MTIVFLILKEGPNDRFRGVQSPIDNPASREKAGFLFAKHKKGDFNIRADLLSRGTPLSSVWALNKGSLSRLMNQLPFKPQVDPF